MRPARPLHLTYAADLYERFAKDLLKRIARRNLGLDEQLIADAVVDAIILLSSSGDVTEKALLRRAYRRLRIRLRAERRQKNREKTAASVTISAAVGLNTLERIALVEVADQYRDQIARTDDERVVLAEWMTGYVNPEEIVARTGFPSDKVNMMLARFRTRIRRLRRECRKEDGR